MSSTENIVKTRLLKEIWQEYLKTVQEKEKERKIKELLLALEEYDWSGDSLSFPDSELVSIGNLLGCELLKVIIHQCEILEHDSALVHYFQKGLGLYLLQVLNILADQVNNGSAEVSNVLVSILPCLLSVACEYKDDDAFALLQKVSMLYKDISSSKKIPQNLYSTLLPSHEHTATKELTILQLFALILDIIIKLSAKGCSFAVAESSFNTAEKLSSLLLSFVKDSASRESRNFNTNEDLPECTWTPTIKLACIYMVMCPLWSVSVGRGGVDAFSHRIDQSELVCKLLEMLKKLKNGIWDGSGFRNLEGNVLEYQLFLMYCLLGMLLTLLKHSVCGETGSHSNMDMTRKLHSKEQVESFVKSGGPELIKFVSLSLNKFHNSEMEVGLDINTLLKQKAILVITTTGQLISAMKKALVFLNKCEDKNLEFSLERVTCTSNPHGQEFRFSRVRSSGSLPGTFESSSDTDSEPHQAVTDISQHQCHFHKDCVVASLCCAMLLLYQESTVEEIDVDCLNSLSRCGTCQCIDVSITSAALLSRFVKRSSHVQDMALGLFCKILLIDQNSPDSNNTNDVFNDETTPTTPERWSCLEQLFLLSTEHGGELTVKILKHLKVLAKFSSESLREALFTKVILPFVLKYKDIKRVNALAQVCRKLAFASSNPDDSGYGTPTETNERDTPKSGDPMVSDDALRISITSLLALLENNRLQKLFLNSDGVKSIVNFLGDESLHPICLGILQLLAVEDEKKTASKKHNVNRNESFEKRNSETASGSAEPVVVNILLRSMLLVDPLKSDTVGTSLSEFAPKIRISLRTPNVSRLLCQLWRTCLELLRRNTVFRELFVQCNGPAYVIAVLQVVKECLYRASSSDDVVRDHVIACVAFIELAVAVGLEFEEMLVDGVQVYLQITEAVKIIQRLVQRNQVLKDMGGKTFCTILLNLAVGVVTEESSSKSDIHDSEKLLFDFGNSDDSGSDSNVFDTGSSKMSRGCFAKDVEPGYEADVEPDNRMSDVSGKENGLCLGQRRRTKESLPKRRLETVQGHVQYPQMCEQLVNLLEHHGEMTANDRALALFGLEGIISLASYSVTNRQILCQQGILQLVLKTFTSCLTSMDVSVKAVQKTVLDLVVVLASYEFSSEELKMYLKFLETNKPAWGLLVKALRNISSLSASCHGPTYTHVFPVQTSTASSESPVYSSSPNSSTRKKLDEQYKGDFKKDSPKIATPKKIRRRTPGRSPALNAPELDGILLSPWCVRSLELNLNQSLPWPVGSFSLAFWLHLDSGFVGYGDGEHRARSLRGRRSCCSHYERRRSRDRLKKRRGNLRKEESGNFVHVVSFGTKTALFEVWVNVSKTTLICRWSRTNTPNNSLAGVSPPKEAFVKFAFKDYVWNHFVLSVHAGREDDVSAGRVTLIVDGSCETTKPLPYPSIAVRKHEQVSVLVGETLSNNKNGPSNSREKLRARPFCRLGNITTFIGDLHRDSSHLSGFISMLNSSSKTNDRLRTMDKLEAAYLYLLGANCQAIDFHLGEETSESYSKQLDLKIFGKLPECSSQSFFCGPHGEPVLVDEQQLNDVKASLKKQLLLVYSAVNPSQFLEYKLEGTNWTGNTSYGDNVMTGNACHNIPLSVVRRKCLVEAIHSVGGIGVFLYLFAKTVEVSDDERAQADTLQIIFTIAKENVIYAKELEGLLAQKMILKVLLTPNCTPGYHFAKVFFYGACEGEVFRETGLHDKPYLVNLNTTAIIKNVEILRDFLLTWRVWYRPSSPLVWETILLALEALTRTSHPNSEFNIKQFQRADALGTLLLGCQEIQAEDFQFPPSITSLLLNIIQNLLGCSADPQVLKRICEFLVAVHPIYETLVLHAPGKIYFTPIVKLQDRKHSRELGEESTASCGGNHENAIDEATVDGKTETGELLKSQNESIENSLESSDGGNIGEQELTERSDVMETTASELCHNELARTNVLNTDDSKDMIISVEHLYKKDSENSDMQFPLQAPELEPKSEDSASFVEVTDDTDGSPQRPVQPNAILSPQGSRKHSEPITIIPREVTTSVAGSYDVVSSSELSVTTKSSSSQMANSNDDYLVVDNKPGNVSTMSTYRHYRRQISEVREHKKLDDLRSGLLELIYSALINLADIAVDIVLGEILKVEYFLCFVNHPVARIRTLSVEILFKILERASTNVVNSFYQMSGYHLLAVQIHLYPITQELAEACFLLFFQQPVSINQPNFFESIKRGSELTKKVNIQAVVPLLGMLEGSVSCPAVFQFLTKCLVRMIDVVEDFLLKATDHGLLKTFVNAVRALCVWRMNNNSGKRSEVETSEELSLDNLQYLVMAIVYRSLRMCGDRYFQIFDDLLLSLDRLQYSEPGSKRLTTLLIQCSRFLQHCAVRFALEYFEYSQRSIKINKRSFTKALRFPFKFTNEMLNLSEGRYSNSVTYWATLDSSLLPVPWKTSRRMSLPAEATPTEVTSRFQDVCMKAVNFIYFSDTWPRADNMLDFNISYSQFTLPPPFEAYKQADSSFLVNATETFTQWTFCFLLELLDFCLNDGMQRSLNKWHELVQQSKEKIRHQLCRLLIHLMCPKQGSKQKLFALQLTKLKRGNEIFFNLLLGAVTTKQKERAVAYVRAFLREPEDDFTTEEKEVRETVREWLKDIEVQKMENSVEDYLLQKQQEWEKQDRNNKRQWENKKELDHKRGEQELHQLYKRMMSVAMEVTKVTVDVQDKQRQNLLKHVKGALSSDVQSHKLWQMLIKQMTHERAVWHDKVFFPTSWQLDRTEGPCRVRCRLQRCHLDLDEKYVMPEYRKQQSSTLPLSYLFEEHCGDGSSKNVYHIFNTTDTIRFLHRCKSIMPARKVQGEILIGEKRVYFVGEETVTDLNTAQFFLDEEDVTSISWLFQEIREILRRRYALKDNALEIFLTNGRTFLLAFETTQDRETVFKELIAKELPNLITATENVSELTQRWQNGELTNFAYLTELNKQACRSFNDLMQYPVFPLVLAEYSCDVLDLTNRSVYRDLSKPVAVQNPSRVPRFQETYRNLQEQYDISKKLDPMNCIPPYHYGSHYSNSGTVLHFLVRLVPFTKIFLTYQDMQFDVPDRTFHAIETTWNLSSFASSPDVKELIPEFFFLPEFLLNSEGFDFGLRQNGERVMNVLLPSWACKDVRLFTLIHRQALESDVVSSTINQWIDLVFGFKQEGEAAVEAVNVFHPSTYVGGIDENKLLEPLQREAVQTMIETYGQTPAPLFTEPHPDRKRIQGLEQCSSWSGTFGESDGQGNQSLRSLTTERDVYRPQEVSSPVPTVFGIKWGQYVGSPTYPKPVLCWSDSFPPLVSNVVSFPSSHVFLLPPNSTHMIVTRWKNRSIHIFWSAVLSWNHVDDILRIRDIKKGTMSCFKENMNLHKVTCCAVSEECRSLWVGSSTGCLCVWPTRYDRTNECGLELLGRRIRLQGHQTSITCVEICEAFSIVVTGSDDRTAIIWDLNRLCYIRCLTGHSTAVDIVSTSPTSGDIVTVCRTETGNASELRLWSVNGRLIKKIVCHQRITCVQFSRAPEGVSVNSIAAGLVNGVVRLWNTWTLEHIGDIKDDTCQLPVVCLAYSHTCHHLFTADSSGTVRAWGRTERASYKPRILNGVVH